MLPETNTPNSLTLARLETRWQAPWLLAGFSHWGQHHAEIGLPNQDAFAFGSVRGTTWMAVADGVSAAPLSGEGAELAVRGVGELLESRLHIKAAADAKLVSGAIEGTRKRLQAHAVAAKRPLGDYATTLLVAVLTDNAVTVAKIGDGYVLALERDNTGATLVPLVENGLHREGGEVMDLTTPSWRTHLRVRHIPDRLAAGIDTIALGSDGCSRYFVRTEHPNDDARRKAVLNADLIDGQLGLNLNKLGARNLFVYLAQLLGHRQFIDEGDDRTLLIATHAGAKGPPCFPTMA